MDGSVARLLIIVALLAGAFALQVTPREEEPQIVVPMVDVLIQSPGLEPLQVERLIITPLEKLLAQIPGVLETVQRTEERYMRDKAMWEADVRVPCHPGVIE